MIMKFKEVIITKSMILIKILSIVIICNFPSFPNIKCQVETLKIMAIIFFKIINKINMIRCSRINSIFLMYIKVSNNRHHKSYQKHNKDMRIFKEIINFMRYRQNRMIQKKSYQKSKCFIIIYLININYYITHINKYSNKKIISKKFLIVYYLKIDS